MAKKELTHIYHQHVRNEVIVVGATGNRNQSYIELFDKSLVLTADLKRLPFLLGGKVYIWFDAHALYNLTLCGVVGMDITAVLMNGTYNADDYILYEVLLDDSKANKDILLTAHGNMHYHVTPLAGIHTEFQVSHWDFEGLIPLFDTLSLMIFLVVDTAVSTTDFVAGKIRAECEIEIDWKPFTKSELQDYLMEHIYAKQGE